MATIEIRTRDVDYISILPDHGTPQHTFLIYTNDNGEQFALRGGADGSNHNTLPIDYWHGLIMPEDRDGRFWTPGLEYQNFEHDITNRNVAFLQANLFFLQAYSEVMGLDDDVAQLKNSLKHSLELQLNQSLTDQAFSNIFETMLRNMNHGQDAIPQRSDPLTLDLDGDGVEMVPLDQSGAFFTSKTNKTITNLNTDFYQTAKMRLVNLQKKWLTIKNKNLVDKLFFAVQTVFVNSLKLS